MRRPCLPGAQDGLPQFVELLVGEGWDRTERSQSSHNDLALVLGQAFETISEADEFFLKTSRLLRSPQFHPHPKHMPKAILAPAEKGGSFAPVPVDSLSLGCDQVGWKPVNEVGHYLTGEVLSPMLAREPTSQIEEERPLRQLPTREDCNSPQLLFADGVLPEEEPPSDVLAVDGLQTPPLLVNLHTLYGLG